MIKYQIGKLKESLILLKNKPFYLFVPILIDLLFLFVAGMVGNFMMTRAVPYLSEIAEIRANVAADTMSDYGASLAVQQAQITPLAAQVVLIFLQLAVALFALWIVFQGFNWFLAARAVDKKVKLGSHCLNFSFISFIAFVITIIIAVLYFVLTLKNALGTNLPSIQSIIGWTTVILALINTYFLYIGYAIAHKYRLGKTCGKIITIGIKDFRKIIFSYVILFILFNIANYIVGLFSYKFEAMIISGIVVVMPLIAYSRIYLIKVIEK